MRSVAILLGRWGSWPTQLMPLLLRTFEHNTWIDFMLLSDHHPALQLPRNVHYHHVTLQQLIKRMQRTVGLKLQSISMADRAGGGSVAKINDLKPMWGEV
jgi:hypothetical protein